MAIRSTENRLKEILGASFVGVDLFAEDLAVDLATIGTDAADWTKLIQGFTPDTNPSLSSQFGLNRAGQTVSQTVHQLHQRIVNTIASTVHTFSPYWDALPGVTVFTAAASITATLRLESFAAYPIGSEIIVIQGGLGAVNIAVEGGVSLFPSAVITNGQGSIIRLFKYAANAWVGSGAIVPPGASSFLARSSGGTANITGNTTVAIVKFAGEVSDPGSNYNPSTFQFTAPSTRRYLFNSIVRMSGMTGAATKAVMALVPSSGNSVIKTWTGNGLVGTDTSFEITAIMTLAAAVTVHVTMQIDGEASNICDVVGASGSDITIFSGVGV